MSGPDIDYNQLREDGLSYTSDRLLEAALVVAGLFNLDDPSHEIIRKHPTLVLGIAQLAHLDERAEERRILKEQEIKVLRDIERSLATLAIANTEVLIGELKESWLKTFPNHTEAELAEAMGYFEKLRFAGGVVRNDDK